MVQTCVIIVDLVKSLETILIQTSIYLQKLASIQMRTGLSYRAKNYWLREKLEKKEQS